MRISINITRNLKKCLFEASNPPHFKKEYQVILKEFIFPNKEMFIAFLDEENFEQQTNLAEKILLRLSFESFFPPPTRLLFNILTMESKLSGEKKDGYIGRDHFVHLVHLYILGIYSFFYQHIFNENIAVLFRNKRSKTQVSSTHLSHSVAKDFVVSWRYFVLFHDIAYPIEYFLGNKSVQTEAKSEYLSAYNNISKSIGKDLSLRSLSKFIGVYKLIKNASEFSFHNLIIPHFWDEKKELTANGKLIIEKIDPKYFQVEKIYGFETIRSLYSIFGRENLLAVLYEKSTMMPVLVYINRIPEEETIVVETKFYKNLPLLNKLSKTKTAPFKKDYSCLKNYQWGFFINSKITLQALVQDIFHDIKLEDFDQTVNYIHDLTSSQYSMVVSEISFKQYCFDIYLALYKLVGYLVSEEISSEEATHFKHLTSVVKNIGKELPVKISDIMKGLLQTALKDVDFEDDMDNLKTVQEVIYKYLKKTSNSFKDLSFAIANPLSSEIQMQYDLKKNLDKVRDAIGTVFINKNIENKILLDIQKDKLIIKELLASTNSPKDIIIENIKNRISQTQLDHFEALLEYKPQYPNIRDNYFDHGISSFIVFLSIVEIYYQLLSIKDDPHFEKLLKVAIGIDFTNEGNYISYKMEDIFSETGYSILTHNLYPEYLKNKKFRTKLESSPFSYFAILMDSLQQWDRKFMINQGVNELPYSTQSKSFNIEMRQNKIRITEFDARLNIQKSLNILKRDIDKYLDKASNYIELNLAEF